MLDKYLTSLSKTLRLLSQRANEVPAPSGLPKLGRFRRNEDGTRTVLSDNARILSREYALCIVGGDRHLCLHDKWADNSLWAVCGDYTIYKGYKNEDFEILCYTDEEPSDVCAGCISVAIDRPPIGYVPPKEEFVHKKMTRAEAYALEEADPNRPLNMFEREYVSKLKAVAETAGINISYLDEDFLYASARKHYVDSDVRRNVDMSGRFSLNSVYAAIVIREKALNEAREYVEEQMRDEVEGILLSSTDSGDETPMPAELAMLFADQEEEPDDGVPVDLELTSLFQSAAQTGNEKES